MQGAGSAQVLIHMQISNQTPHNTASSVCFSWGFSLCYNAGCMTVQGNAVVAALVELFRSFADKESKVWGSGQRQVVSPTALRKALHAWSQAKFHVGAFTLPPPPHPSLVNHLFYIPQTVVDLVCSFQVTSIVMP